MYVCIFLYNTLMIKSIYDAWNFYCDISYGSMDLSKDIFFFLYIGF